jgi:hypothetical protein
MKKSKSKKEIFQLRLSNLEEEKEKTEKNWWIWF